MPEIVAATLDSSSLPETTDTFQCAGGYSLSAVGSGCSNGFKEISVKPYTGGTSVQGCLSTTNSGYGTAISKGCSYYKLSPSIATSPFPIFTGTLTCQGVSL